MGAVRLLWIDLCSQLPVHGLFQYVPSKHEAVRVDRLESVATAIQQLRPRLACVEFDYPDRTRLQAVPLLRNAAPKLPLLMFTEYHSEALAVWAFRSGVRDYRVKPINPRTLARILEVLLTLAESELPQRPSDSWLPADLIEPAGHLQRPPAASQRTGLAVAYIARHFGEDLRRGALAELCHLCPSEFSRAFRREQGTTFEHFLLEYRIAQARELLATPYTTISQAAYSTGFSDPSYFARVFRRVAGVTATEYQERVRLSVARAVTAT